MRKWEQELKTENYFIKSSFIKVRKLHVIILLLKAKCLNHTFCLKLYEKFGKNSELLCVKYINKIQTYLKRISLFQTICIKIPALLLASCVALGMSLNLSGSQFPHLEGKIQYLITFSYGLNADRHIVSIQ